MAYGKRNGEHAEQNLSLLKKMRQDFAVSGMPGASNEAKSNMAMFGMRVPRGTKRRTLRERWIGVAKVVETEVHRQRPAFDAAGKFTGYEDFVVKVKQRKPTFSEWRKKLEG